MKFHQALFGYDGGHHLLGSSLPLSTDVKHQLAVATDLSGSAPVGGFDASFTGLPLTGINYYALFCTWLAPEMPRPGCVWSHVLFIEFADLANLGELGELRSAFRHPSSASESSVYQSQLTFFFDRSVVKTTAPMERSRMREILAALYMTPDQSVVATTNDAAQLEDLIFSIWSQQWPRLRRGFRFSSGSFADRGRTGSQFDLQVSPLANQRAWQRSAKYLLLNNESTPDNTSIAPKWLRDAEEDLVEPDHKGFRSFLRSYGADVDDPRSAFARLGAAFYCLERAENEDSILPFETIGSLFPERSDALTLKNWMIKKFTSIRDQGSVGRSLAIVSFLLSSESAAPYAAVVLDLSQLAREAWPIEKKEVLTFLAHLIRQPEGPSAISFAVGVANAIQPNDLRLIADERPELIPVVIGHRPALATHVEAWELPTNTQWRMYEALDSLALGNEEWGEIMAAMLIAATNVAVREAVERAGSYAIEGALRWLSHSVSQQYLPSQGWRDALAEAATSRLQNTNLFSPTALAFCSWLVPPKVVRETLNAARKDVQQLARQALEELPAPLRLHTAFLVVTLGLRAGGNEGIELLSRGFFPVYDALASDNYSSDSWQLLSTELPHLGIWKEWDRCRKLRKAVRKQFSSEKHLVARRLLESAASPDNLATARHLFKDLPL
ncbi:MAG TPA: hypothetical protein VGN17_10705 [Bryobacteraceae bacterium]